jgi:DNA-binding PadR family transcriptional regulator
MSAIDLIVLGLVKQQPQGAYDIQKELESRSISRWVRVSVPSIYKKVIQLEEKGYIQSSMIKAGKMPEKAVYQLTEKGETYFLELMEEISNQTVNIFLDLNSVIVNLDNVPLETKLKCLNQIEANILNLTETLNRNIIAKPNSPMIGRSVLLQQFSLAETLKNWIVQLKSQFEKNPDDE